MDSSTAPSSTSNQAPPKLTTAFPQTNDGGASTSAGLASPTTPFSQSTLPSKSLLSRQVTSASIDPELPGAGTAGADGAQPSPLNLPKGILKNLKAVIRQLFERCYRDGRYRQVVGIAVEARELDVLREVILKASRDSRQTTEEKQGSQAAGAKGEELMEYVLDICMGVVQERGLRNQVRPPMILICSRLSSSIDADMRTLRS